MTLSNNTGKRLYISQYEFEKLIEDISIYYATYDIRRGVVIHFNMYYRWDGSVFRYS